MCVSRVLVILLNVFSRYLDCVCVACLEDNRIESASSAGNPKGLIKACSSVRGAVKR